VRQQKRARRSAPKVKKETKFSKTATVQQDKLGFSQLNFSQLN
jgi:hypothetical protein